MTPENTGTYIKMADFYNLCIGDVGVRGCERDGMGWKYRFGLHTAQNRPRWYTGEDVCFPTHTRRLINVIVLRKLERGDVAAEGAAVGKCTERQVVNLVICDKLRTILTMK